MIRSFETLILNNIMTIYIEREVSVSIPFDSMLYDFQSFGKA